MPSSLLRMDVLPVAVGYLLLMGALAAGVRLLRAGGPAGTGREGAPGPAPGRPAPPEIPGPAGIRGPAEPPGPSRIPGPPAAGWTGLARRYAGTALGGYLLLMAVVMLYYYGVARVSGPFIASAFTGCALLIALSAPVFALASWLDMRRRARPGRKAGG